MGKQASLSIHTTSKFKVRKSFHRTRNSTIMSTGQAGEERTRAGHPINFLVVDQRQVFSWIVVFLVSLDCYEKFHGIIIKDGFLIKQIM